MFFNYSCGDSRFCYMPVNSLNFSYQQEIYLAQLNFQALTFLQWQVVKISIQVLFQLGYLKYTLYIYYASHLVIWIKYVCILQNCCFVADFRRYTTLLLTLQLLPLPLISVLFLFNTVRLGVLFEFQPLTRTFPRWGGGLGVRDKNKTKHKNRKLIQCQYLLPSMDSPPVSAAFLVPSGDCFM